MVIPSVSFSSSVSEFDRRHVITRVPRYLRVRSGDVTNSLIGSDLVDPVLSVYGCVRTVGSHPNLELGSMYSRSTAHILMIISDITATYMMPSPCIQISSHRNHKILYHLIGSKWQAAGSLPHVLARTSVGCVAHQWTISAALSLDAEYCSPSWDHTDTAAHDGKPALARTNGLLSSLCPRPPLWQYFSPILIWGNR